ncbi:MAG: MBL fold metallo-hydrolase [Gaiellaceae bacterium]
MAGRGDSEEVARGVYRLGTKWANFYLVSDGGEAMLIDAGYPGYFAQLEAAAAALAGGLQALRGVIVTHHHLDHAGTAGAVHSRAGATVFAHEGDAAKLRGEIASHPPSGFYGEGWRPSMIRYLAHTVGAGGVRYRPVSELTLLEDGQELDLPGRPRIIYTPGHTAGHCSALLPDRGVLACGDAMVNFDYASGQTGLRLHRFNEDRESARATLARLGGALAEILLFGHGDPWRGEPRRAVEQARSER